MGKISDGAVMPITQESYPETYAAWGGEGVARINALMQPAAELVVASPGCDRLEVLGLSARSVPPENIVFYADCANGNRFFITKADVAEERQSVSQNEKSKWLTDGQLVAISQEAVKAELQRPCAFLGTGVYRAVVGRIVVTVEFSVENVLGTSSVGIAKCYFDGLSLKEVELRC